MTYWRNEYRIKYLKYCKKNIPNAWASGYKFLPGTIKKNSSDLSKGEVKSILKKIPIGNRIENLFILLLRLHHPPQLPAHLLHQLLLHLLPHLQ